MCAAAEGRCIAAFRAHSMASGFLTKLFVRTDHVVGALERANLAPGVAGNIIGDVLQATTTRQLLLEEANLYIGEGARLREEQGRAVGSGCR